MSDTLTLDFFDAPVEVKADEGRGMGLFAALVSVFGNKDRNGDRVLRGAFAKTKAAWKQSGNPIPVIYGHQHGDPNAIIGSVWPDDMTETKDGLAVAGRLDIDTNPLAADVFAKLKAGLITSWSFAFETKDSEVATDGVRELKELDLFEVGPVLIGANPEARTLALKSANTITLTPRGDGTLSVTDSNGTIDYWNPNGTGTVVKPVETPPVEPDPEPAPIEAKAGRRISRSTAARIASVKADIQKATARLDELLEEVEDAAPVTKADLARQEMADVSTFLSERGMG